MFLDFGQLQSNRTHIWGQDRPNVAGFGQTWTKSVIGIGPTLPRCGLEI